MPDLRELISDFYNSRYASCLSYLEKLRVRPLVLLFFSLFLSVCVWTACGWLCASSPDLTPQPYLELDIFLASHVNSIYDKIRSKAIIQYFSPYVSVNLNVMAEAFKTTVPSLEKVRPYSPSAVLLSRALLLLSHASRRSSRG